MLFSMRLSVRDEPGVLGAVATELGRAGVNIVSLDVIDIEDGVAIDDLCVEASGDAAMADALRRTAERVPGALVEAVRPMRDPSGPAAPIELCAVMAESAPADALSTLVEGLPSAMGASWAVALRSGSPPPIVAASPGTPSLTNVDTPWMPLGRPRRLGSALMDAAGMADGTHVVRSGRRPTRFWLLGSPRRATTWPPLPRFGAPPTRTPYARVRGHARKDRCSGSALRTDPRRVNVTGSI